MERDNSTSTSDETPLGFGKTVEDSEATQLSIDPRTINTGQRSFNDDANTSAPPISPSANPASASVHRFTSPTAPTLTWKEEDPDDTTLRSIEPFPSIQQPTKSRQRTLARPRKSTARPREGSLPPWAGSNFKPRASILSTRPSTFGSPSFSLAGSNTPVYTRDAHGGWVDDDYVDYSSRLFPEEKPVWSLAKALPRVVRPGMRPREDSDDGETEAVEVEEKGDVEAVPQVQQIPEQRERERSTRIADARRTVARATTTTSRQDHTPTIRQIKSGNSAQVDGSRERWNSLRGHITTGRKSSAGQNQRPLEDEIDVPPPILEASESEEQAAESGIEKEEPEFLNTWSRYRHRLREPLAETFGTMIALTVGLCGSLSATTSSDTAGSFSTGNWAFAFGVMIAIYVAGGISGAHLNPAVSIMLAIFRGFPWRMCAMYCVCQLLGAIAAGGIADGLYRDAILVHDGNQLITNSTGVAFFTGPKAWVSPTTAFFNEIVASAILGATILALGDDTNAPPGAGMHAFILSLVIYALCTAFTYNTGNCLNPVRDLGPRLVTLMAGYGRDVFTSDNYWWIWGPWIADCTGILIGAALYDVCIFVGGESPVNYPRRRRKRAEMKWKARWSRRLGRRGTKVRRLEEKVEANS